VNACESDDAGNCIDVPVALNQNSMVNMVVSTSGSNDVVITGIKDLTLQSDRIASKVIKDFSSDGLTSVESIDGGKKSVVKTKLVSAFFDNLGTDETSSIEIVGTAVMEFKSSSGRSRKLVRIGSTGQKSNNAIRMNRNLDEEDDVADAGIAEFKMKVGISGAKVEANGAAISGADDTVSSRTPSMIIASLALGGTLVGMIV
jgi:hypothetical protein